MTKLWIVAQAACLLGMFLNLDNNVWTLFAALLGVAFCMMIISLDNDEE
ncbi:hypothetical protein [Priestia megaterium]|nr:hypothetical protein [Priestia megaterium]